MMLKWFDSTEVDKFATWVSQELVKRYPPEGVDTDPKKAAKRLQKVHESLFLRVEAFAKENKLNVYKRARLGNQIKWAMRDAGYPLPFSEAFTHEVVTVISVINARPAQAAQKR
jgi:mRNA-degrading endonuclease RelE of RelBE toxin-antitoxin system